MISQGRRSLQFLKVTCFIVRTELVVSNALVVSISNALMFFCKARGHLLNGRLRVSRSSVPLLRFSSFSLFSKVVIHPIACNIHDRFPMVIPMGVGTKSRRCGCGLVSWCSESPAVPAVDSFHDLWTRPKMGVGTQYTYMIDSRW